MNRDARRPYWWQETEAATDDDSTPSVSAPGMAERVGGREGGAAEAGEGAETLAFLHALKEECAAYIVTERASSRSQPHLPGTYSRNTSRNFWNARAAAAVETLADLGRP